MNNQIIRLLSFHITNVNNIEAGTIEIEKRHLSIDSINSRVVGVYGQNGSGKTSVIKVLSILQTLLSGRSLSENICELFRYGSNEMSGEFHFQMISDLNNYIISYSFELKKEEIEEAGVQDLRHGYAVVNKEKLYISEYKNGTWTKRKTLADYDSSKEDMFLNPVKKYSQFFAGKETFAKINVIKALSLTRRTSFLFSSNFMHFLLESMPDKKIPYNNELINIIFLTKYAINDLLVIDNEDRGMISLNLMIPVNLANQSEYALPKVYVNLHKPTIASTKIFDFIQERITAISKILTAMIPGLSLVIKSESQKMDDGKDGIRFELLSNRDGIEIPLHCESEGILKIISILDVIAQMYNNTSAFVAIDELDAGVFEYLLGELLSVISETGKGQLLFTSHNLRPLEMIPPDSIVFTTTNPSNRFIRFTNIRPTNNLRDLYLRAINLGGQKEVVYEPTHDWEIRKALRFSGAVNSEE